MKAIIESNLHWNALYVNYKAEKKVKEELERIGIETFLPLYTKVKVYNNRKRKNKIPLITCYVFAKIPKELKPKVYNINGFVKFVKAGDRIANIPVNEIETLKQINGIESEIENESFFNIGESIIINNGPFSGLKGEIFQKRGKKRFLIKMHTLKQALSVELTDTIMSSIT